MHSLVDGRVIAVGVTVRLQRARWRSRTTSNVQGEFDILLDHLVNHSPNNATIVALHQLPTTTYTSRMQPALSKQVRNADGRKRNSRLTNGEWMLFVRPRRVRTPLDGRHQADATLVNCAILLPTNEEARPLSACQTACSKGDGANRRG